MKHDTTAVLVVGGSLVGLSAGLFLAWHGVPTIVVERHPGSSLHPRAIGYTQRTLEVLRAVGLEDRIPQAPPTFRLRRTRIESLAGKWFDETAWTPSNEAQAANPVDASPCSGAAIAQDKMEPLLRARAIELGADVRVSTKVTRFEQDANGVTAWLEPRDGEPYTVRADYLIGADGGRSDVRKALGIGTSGRGHMRTIRSVLFRAPLDEYLTKGVVQFEIDQPGFQAFLTTYFDGRWMLLFHDDLERSESELRAAIARAIGREDVPVEIVTQGRWELGAVVADRFSSGRVFLAGDAAHCFPPSRGGYGANTGIHDAHNLAWKLAAVVAKKAAPALLDTYDAERRPVAWVRHQQIFARPDYATQGNGIADGEPIRDDIAMELGQIHRSRGILGAGDDLPAAARPDEWKGQPGTRAPHVWIERDGAKMSTLDLFSRSWVLLTDDPQWAAAAENIAKTASISLQTTRIDALSPADEVRRAFGIARGASLVRPDGYIAWRSPGLSADAENALRRAVEAASFAIARADD